jgi:sterol desaturase/sphingolipid hydroxylase (fatty acid hydroxylase superfamily)
MPDISAALAPTLFLLAAFILLSLMEYWRPNQRYTANPAWFRQLFWLQIGGVALTSVVGWLISDDYQQRTLFPTFSAPFQQLPAIMNGLIGYLVVTFINYWWHRFRHENDLLWRLFHQIHHSTHRLQTATALYSHPLDYASTVFIINVVAYGLFGFDALSAAWTTAWVGVFELWEHTNIRTPRWLGYLIVRPEMHRIHHELDRHRNNYAIPLWDALFGTYENPRREVVCGFHPEREARFGEMLRFKDVHKT